MYARRLRSNYCKWNLLLQRGKDSSSFNCGEYYSYHSLASKQRAGNNILQGGLARRYLSEKFNPSGISLDRWYYGLEGRSSLRCESGLYRLYSSKGDGRSPNEGKHASVKDGANLEKGKTRKEKNIDDLQNFDAHARLGEQDQKDWLNNEKLAIESKKRESPFLTKRERFKNEFMRRLIPWEKITVTWDNFPYYIDGHTRNLLVECAASHLKHEKSTTGLGSRLTSSSGRILLQSIPGTELYRERMVKALAQDLQVPLLLLDSSVLAPFDFSQDSETESEDSEDCTTESEVDDDNDATNEDEYTSSGEAKAESSDEEEIDIQASAEALKKLLPCNLEEFEKRISGESETVADSSEPKVNEPADCGKQPLKKGDRVKYVGPSCNGEEKRPLSSGQRGEVYEVKGDHVAVVWDVSETDADGAKDEKTSSEATKPSLHWIKLNDVELDLDAQSEDCYVAIQALHEVLLSLQPLIVYFPDSSLWLSRAASKSNRKEFVQKLGEMFDQLAGPVVLICGQNKVETGSKEKEKFTMILPNLGRLAKLPLSLKTLTEGLKERKQSVDDEIYKLFTNVMCIHPPKEEDVLRTFNKQVEEDRRLVIARSNLNELHKVLDENDLACIDLLQLNTDGVILTKRKAESVVGWAKNHYLASCLHPCIKGNRLYIPRESLEIALLRLKEQETLSKKPSQSIKNLAKDEYESNFVSAVVPPGEIGVKFDDIGALEDVKKALNELVILPMRRPELFTRGNLLRPCKGILLFGPPGTGKTLLAKALATEAGANFISITGSTLTSKWFGDAEKLTKALFSFASKLAPVIIFVDEVDSLLGARGGAFEHEATRRMRNEFMAAWDGLRSKDSQRILILGATNRPFDLDDAVIRRLPRRIYVDLPDAENRLKILKIILARENLESDFMFEHLANATEGYSGSDLKNLCVAAAYRPVQELLEEEATGAKEGDGSPLRPLNLDDFIQSKAKVGPSVAYDATSMNELRKWNEQYGEGGSRRKSPFGF
ncbi:OLC1v1033241C1 [Oldenlandia corymbosa var. corymbosa]|uniref:OLC1v1033241C1 n=1 Tax=Oldenlandia corymbosa var. corymbosa TaxID=529605 RepID=A0AAV1CNN0_OLDCO|nr:OLC1v1033241C1 [Oldenlandia corymbosa var. corymbosa]